jgi:hypothetical protein
MPLPDNFQFSQASLQDFVDCPRRFQLRYLLNVAWPAAEAEPIEEQERRSQLGLAFHRMVQQQLVGIPEARLSKMAVDPDLERWWRHYCVHRPADVLLVDSAVRYPEVTLTAALGGHRLVAKYDLVIVQPGVPGSRAVIFDWKTSPVRTKLLTLKARLQTRVYRYLLVRSSAHLNGGQRLEPAQIEMIYWFAEHPESPVRLPYDDAQYRDDEVYLTGLIEEIQGMPDEAFAPTDDEKRCKYCPYRSYCDRGVKAGDVMESEGDFEGETGDLGLDFDFEQIAEIAF